MALCRFGGLVECRSVKRMLLLRWQPLIPWAAAVAHGCWSTWPAFRVLAGPGGLFLPVGVRPGKSPSWAHPPLIRSSRTSSSASTSLPVPPATFPPLQKPKVGWSRLPRQSGRKEDAPGDHGNDGPVRQHRSSVRTTKGGTRPACTSQAQVRAYPGGGTMSIDGEERRVIHYLSITLSFYQVTVGELWLRYIDLGGEMRSYEVDEWLRGLRSLPVFECILLRMALDDVRDGRPPSTPQPGFGSENP